MAKIELKAEVTGKVWKVAAPVGSRVDDGDTVLVVESMKMEIPIIAECAGTVVELKVAEGAAVVDGQLVAVLET